VLEEGRGFSPAFFSCASSSSGEVPPSAHVQGVLEWMSLPLPWSQPLRGEPRSAPTKRIGLRCASFEPREPKVERRTGRKKAPPERGGASISSALRPVPMAEFGDDGRGRRGGGGGGSCTNTSRGGSKNQARAPPLRLDSKNGSPVPLSFASLRGGAKEGMTFIRQQSLPLGRP